MATNEERRIDRWLEAGLREYGSGEPRLGLEGRVLARLRTQKAVAVERWVWWPAGAMAIVGVIAVVTLLISKPETPAPVAVATQRSQPRSMDHARQEPVSNRHGTPAKAHNSGAPVSTVVPSSETPRLERFPSPQPLSDQEALLANYVREFRSTAVLIARAREEVLDREQRERAEITDDGGSKQSESSK